ncbi:helix-turn-helix domain-containing protein [Halioxenophilus aromaticivorans]|uniref:Helix-turn-helix domain-containing protein n=1 Tax=Halioxenophilus aromaticivorans TaxID=1306992 RepID=A0AAV3U423_9ALTE
MAPTHAADILTTTLYGESDAWQGIDEVHCEPLVERSAKHDWQIEPHRHVNLVQIFYLSQGECEASIDEQKTVLTPGALVILPEHSVHGFRWRKDSYGYVLMITRSLLTRMEQNLGPQHWSRNQGSVSYSPNQQPLIAQVFAQLLDEYRHQRPQRAIMLEAITLNLMVLIDRLHSEQHRTASNSASKLKQLERFIELVEHNFQQHHQVNWYAEKLGITPAHLNSLCKQEQQLSALKLIHQRIMQEAQRQLIYSGKSASTVASLLGFEDPAYFNRFFTRLAGKSPGNYRKQWAHKNQPE